ncbi:MAG: enoyl-CoA hydratase/isomerase family protein, partial [Dehalococcoidia bacterium]|nr:enoyl-CoA hydratase/isomerase family protein [Dehalococcoidia bacterium]
GREPYCLYEVDREAKIARITFNKPEKLNMADSEEYMQLTARIIEAGEDPDVKVIILKGAGDHFSSGADTSLIIGDDTLKPGEVERPRSQGFRTVELRNSAYGRRSFNQTPHNSPKVTICQVHGYCYGGHFQIASGCDFIVASDEARFTHPGYRYIGPMGEDMVLMILKIGLTKTKEIMFTGRGMTAQEALDCGMVNKVVPLDSLEDETNKLAELICRQAADSLYIGKQNFNTALAIMGKQAQASAGLAAHVWAHMMRSEPDEFNLIRSGREGGTKGALAANKERWKDSSLVKPKE